MAELKYAPVSHNQKAFLAKTHTRKGFSRAYNALALEYQVAGQMLEPALFTKVRDETAEMPSKTGAWSREGGRHA
jgi:hypothetical protein